MSTISIGSTNVLSAFKGTTAIKSVYRGAVKLLDFFSPLSLFANGEQGVWYEPSTTTAFRSTTDLTPCDYGQSAGFLLDLSKGAGYSGGSFTGLGSELVANGAFSTDLSGWTTTAWVWDASGRASLNTTTNLLTIRQNLGLITGKFYLISFDYEVITGSGQIGVEGTNSANILFGVGSGSIEFVWQVPATGSTVFFRNLTATTEMYIDNVSVRELPGNHATQSSEPARPILARVPEGGRRNLLERTEEFDDAVWTKIGGSISPDTVETTDPLGGNTADKIINVSGINAYQEKSGAISEIRTFSVYLKKSGTESSCELYIYQVGVAFVVAFDFNFDTETSTLTQGAGSASIQSVGGGWYRCSVTATLPASATYSHGVYNATEVYAWGAQLEASSSASAYQKVVDQYDITEAGVTSLEYLAFDGADDFMALPNIPFSSDTGFNAFMGADTSDLQSDYRVAFSRGADDGVYSAGTYFGGTGGNSYKPNLYDQSSSKAINVLTRNKAVFAWQVSLTSGSTRTAITRVNQSQVLTSYNRTLTNNEVFTGLNSSFGTQIARVNIYSAILRCAAPLTAQEISDTETYLANLSGVEARTEVTWDSAADTYTQGEVFL